MNFFSIKELRRHEPLSCNWVAVVDKELEQEVLKRWLTSCITHNYVNTIILMSSSAQLFTRDAWYQLMIILLWVVAFAFEFGSKSLSYRLSLLLWRKISKLSKQWSFLHKTKAQYHKWNIFIAPDSCESGEQTSPHRMTIWVPADRDRSRVTMKIKLRFQYGDRLIIFIILNQRARMFIFALRNVRSGM